MRFQLADIIMAWVDAWACVQHSLMDSLKTDRDMLLQAAVVAGQKLHIWRGSRFVKSYDL
jgi:hypothetical protein